jgi:hypothetical protein
VIAEDGKIFDSVFFSAKAAEIQFKRLRLANRPIIGEIEFNRMKIEFLPNGAMKIGGGACVTVENGVVVITPAE